MRILTALLSSTLLAMLTSCAGTPANDDVNMPFGAAPMGEVAMAQPASPCVVMAPQTMPLHWHRQMSVLPSVRVRMLPLKLRTSRL